MVRAMHRQIATICPEFVPNARDRRWFIQIDRHGPQASTVLYAVTRDTHRCKDTALRRLQALREAGYLHLPPQQQEITKANFNPHVYDLTSAGFEHLSYHQPLERRTRPTGHWWHRFWVSSVSSIIEICARQAGCSYVPACRILSLRDVSLAIPLTRGRIIPDQLLALKYPDGYLAFALEVDRGTEPIQSPAARKSLRRSVQQYREVLKHKLHQTHYGLKSNLLVLYVFLSPAREQQFRNLLTPEDHAFQTIHLPDRFPRHTAIEDVILKALFAGVIQDAFGKGRSS